MKLSYPVVSQDAHDGLMAWNSSAYDRVFPKLREYGYQGIELLVRDYASVDRMKLKQQLFEYDLQLSAIGTTPMQKEDGLYLLDRNKMKAEAARTRLRDLLELAAEFEVPVLIGKYRGIEADTETCSFEALTEVIAAADQRAEALGTFLLLEPQSEGSVNYLHSVGETAEWIRENGFRQVGILADLFHMYHAEPSVCESLKQYSRLIWMIHMTDSKRLVPGFGDFFMTEILETLEAIKFAGFLSMEIRQYPSSEGAAHLAAASLRYLEGVRKGEVFV